MGRFLFMLLLAASALSASAESEVSIVEIVTQLFADQPGEVADLPIKETEGFVSAVDYEKRLVVIDGYNYYFAPQGMGAEILRLDGGKSVFELLEPGTAYSVKYLRAEGIRIPVQLIQVRTDEVELY